MEIKRDGFVFQMAYGIWENKEKPTGEINICALPWRFLFGCIYWLSFTLVFVSTAPLMWAFSLFPLGLRDGERPVWRSDEIPFGFRRLPGYAYIGRLLPICYHWEKIKSPTLRALRMVVLAVLAILALFSLFWLIGDSKKADRNALEKVIDGGTILVACFAIALALFSSAVWCPSLFHSEPARLLRAWLKAKKEKICPIIKIVD